MAEPKTELQRNAIALKARHELEEYLREVDLQWLDGRTADGRMNRTLARLELEKKIEKEIQEKTDHDAIVNARAEREIALAREIENHKRLEIQELERRRMIRENDPEIKELTKKLRAGYVCRDRKQQIADNEHRRLQEKIENRYNDTIMTQSTYTDKEKEEKEAREEFQRKAVYRRELQQQLGNAQRTKQCKYEESLIEKKMIDQVLKTMYDEDMRELELKHQKTNALRQEMLTSQQARDAWREKQRRLLIEQEKKFEKEEAELQSRKQGQAAERERKFREKEEFNRKLAEKVLNDEFKRQERNMLIAELQQLELDEKGIQEDAAKQVKVERDNMACMSALIRQMQERKNEQVMQKQVDRAYRDEVANKIAEDDAKEREKQEKRKQMMKNYSAELMKQIEDNKHKRQTEKEQEELRNQSVWGGDAKWRDEVKKEREKIIEEHAPHIIGYLQSGVLKNEDLPAVRRGANKHPHLASMNIEAMASNRQATIHPKCNAQCKIIREY